MAPKKKAASSTPETSGEEHNTDAITTTTTTTTTTPEPTTDTGASATATLAETTSGSSGGSNNNSGSNTVAVTAAAPPTPAPVGAAGQATGTTSIVTVFAQLQGALAADAEAINEHVGEVLELMQAAESGSVGGHSGATSTAGAVAPLLLRVRVLEFVARHVGHLHDNAALKKIVTSVVRVLSGDDNTTPLLVAATQCLAGLGTVAVRDKSCEYLAREGADVLMQVMLDTAAFAEPVRQAAGKALDALTTSAFRPVVTKLLHWLSDAREEDTGEQLLRERRLALSRLTRLAMSPSMASLWTDETQQFVLSLLPRILASVDAHEYAQLLRVVAHLPLVAAQHGAPLLQCVLQDMASGKPDSERALEALAMAARFVSPPPAAATAAEATTTAAATAETTTAEVATTTTTTDAATTAAAAATADGAVAAKGDGQSPDSGASVAALTTAAAELMATLQKAQLLTTAIEADGTRGVLHSRVVLLACRLARVLAPEAVEQLTHYTLAQLQRLILGGEAAPAELPGEDEESAAAAAAAVPLQSLNLSTLESLLFAAVALMRGHPVELRQRLQAAALQRCLTALARCAADTLPLAQYATRKLAQQATPTSAATTTTTTTTATAAAAAETAPSSTTTTTTAAAAAVAEVGAKASDYDELLASLQNIRALADALAVSRLPQTELQPSWIGGGGGRAAGNRNRATGGGAAARAGTTTTTQAARQRRRGRDGRGANNNNNNNNSGGTPMGGAALPPLPPSPATRAAAAAAGGGGGGIGHKRSRSAQHHTHGGASRRNHSTHNNNNNGSGRGGAAAGARRRRY